MQSRNEEILTAIADGTSSSELKPAQSREEALLLRILDRVNDLGELGGKFKVHICTSSEYDHLTGIPTILGPEENTFYLVPSGSGTDMYKEWVYTNGNWELFGGGGGGSIDVPVTDVQVNGVSVLDAQGVAEIPNAGEDTYGLVRGSDIPVESGTGDKSVVTKPCTIGATTYSNIASGLCAFAEGLLTTASGTTSHAEGQNTTASGTSSHAEGQNTNASALTAHAEGVNTIASDFSSHAEGCYTQASGRFSHAEGNHTVAQGQGEHAGGAFNTISATIYSEWEAGKEYDVGDIVINGPLLYRCKVANAENTFKLSYWSEYQLGSTLYSHIVGNGTADDARSNAYALTWTGDGKYAGDVYVHANTDSSGGTKLATVDDVTVTDVQVNGTSVVSNGVAEIPKASESSLGVIKVSGSWLGHAVNGDGILFHTQPSNNYLKGGSDGYHSISPINQHVSAFYGLAKAAGSDEKNSTLPFGQYRDATKSAIQNMIGVNWNRYELIRFLELDEDLQTVIIDADESSSAFALNGFVIAINSVGASGSTTEGYLKIALNSSTHGTNRICDIISGTRREGNTMSICVCCLPLINLGHIVFQLRTDSREWVNATGELEQTVYQSNLTNAGLAFSNQKIVSSVFIGTDNATYKMGIGTRIALYGCRI